MTDVVDNTVLEKYELWANNEHPDVLPGCVEALNKAQENAFQQVDICTQWRQAESNRFLKKLGFASMAGVVAGISTYAITQEAMTSRLAALPFAVYCVRRFFTSRPEFRDRENLQTHLEDQYATIHSFYTRARTRAEEMNLIPSETEPQDSGTI